MFSLKTLLLLICFLCVLFYTECPTVQVPHALVNPATSVSHGTTVTIECQSSFTLVGNPTPTCHNGTFTDIPSCEKTDVFDITGNRLLLLLHDPQ